MAEDARARPSLPPVLEARAGVPHQNGSRTSARAGPFGAGQKCQRTKSPEHPSTRDRWGVVGKQPASVPNRGTVLVYSLCPSTPVCLGWSCHPGLAVPLPCPSSYSLPAPSGVTSTQTATFTSWVRSALGELDVDTGSALFLWPPLRNGTSLR